MSTNHSFMIKVPHFTGTVSLLIDMWRDHHPKRLAIDLFVVFQQYIEYLSEGANSKHSPSLYSSDLMSFAYLLHYWTNTLVVLPTSQSTILDTDAEREYQQKINRILKYERVKVWSRSLKEFYQTDGQKLISPVISTPMIDNSMRTVHHTTPNLVWDNDQLLRAWNYITEQIEQQVNFTSQTMTAKVDISFLKKQIIDYIAGHAGQQWNLLPFLLHFAHNFSELLCVLLLTLEMIYQHRLVLKETNEGHWTIDIK